jgi:hypothetical protein
MLFCLGYGQYESKGKGYQKSYQVFNKDVEKKEWEEIKSSLDINILPTEWIDKKDMTKEEKENSSVWKEIGGYLKTFSYKEAWANWWKDASQKDKNKILNIKYFDPIIFKEITSIDVKKETSLIGQEVEVKMNGKTYKAKVVSEE